MGAPWTPGPECLHKGACSSPDKWSCQHDGLSYRPGHEVRQWRCSCGPCHAPRVEALIAAREAADAVYQRAFAAYINHDRWCAPEIAGESFRAVETARKARREAADTVDAVNMEVS